MVTQYELPYSWNPMVIYYNTARLQEAGLEPPPSDWTRDDFLEYAQALTVDANGDGTPEKYGYAFDNSGLFVSAMPWIYANGGDIVTDDFCAPTVTDPKVEEALQFMHDLIYVDKVAPAPTSLNTPVPVDPDGRRGDDRRRALGAACTLRGELHRLRHCQLARQPRSTDRVRHRRLPAAQHVGKPRSGMGIHQVHDQQERRGTAGFAG